MCWLPWHIIFIEKQISRFSCRKENPYEILCGWNLGDLSKSVLWVKELMFLFKNISFTISVTKKVNLSEGINNLYKSKETR